MMLSSRYLLSYLLIARCLAFQAPALLSKSSLSSSCPSSRNLQHRLARQHQSVQQRLFMTSDDDTTSNNNLVEETTTETTAASSIPTSISASSSSSQPPAASSATEEKPYPIDVPSPILLASSIFLSIASIGSIFDLTTKSDDIPLGFGPTAAIAALGIPTSLFLFYAAILKGTAETEEDDKDFRANK